MTQTRPTLQTNGLPILAEDPSSTPTASPARGRPMINNLVSRFRPIPLVHEWVFWHEKPADADPSPGGPSIPQQPAYKTPTPASAFATQLSTLHTFADVRGFWSSFNNITFPNTPLRHSYHLFHAHVRPLWEDPRNAHGGAWTFRVPKQHAEAVFQTVCLLAIGEQLQQCVHEEGRVQFKDDICGVSFCMRVGSVLVKVWNRDAGHAEGIARIRDAVVAAMPEGVGVGESGVFYKAHREHEGFSAGPDMSADAKAWGRGSSPTTAALDQSIEATIAKATAAAVTEDAGLARARETSAAAKKSVEAMEDEVERVKKVLEEVQIKEDGMTDKLAHAAAEE